MRNKMSNFQQQYKGRRFGFSNTEESRLIRAEKREELRKEQRVEAFNKNRNISNSTNNGSESAEVQSPVAEDRLTRLRKWKEERERRKKIEQKKKKPPFKVGVVHHKIYSPITSDQTITSNKTHEKTRNQTTATVPKRITRATEKRLMRKAVMKEVPNQTTKTLKPLTKEEKNKKKQNESFAPVDYKFKAPTGLPDIPLFGRVAMKSMSPGMSEVILSSINMPETSRRCSTTEFIIEDIDNEKDNVSEKGKDDSEDSSIEPVLLKLSDDETFTCSNKDNSHDNNNGNNIVEPNNSIHSSTIVTFSPSKNNRLVSTPNNSQNEPIFYSPYIVSSRGKINARKEEQIKRGFSFNRSKDDDIPRKDTVIKNLNISVEEEERTAQYFRFLLNREIDRLNELCTKWTDIKGDVTTTEDGQYEINQAIGQTNLLISKKFERFRGLVADCETGNGEMLVTCKDLQGFWDMMYMEVRNCDTRFEKLEKLRSQNWVEEQTPTTKIIRKNKSKIITRKKPVSTKSSSITTFLTEKRKNITQQVKNNGNTEKSKTINNQGLNTTYESDKNSPSIKDKVRRSTVFLRSTKCTPIKENKTRLSLLQQTQLPIVSKEITTPLTMIKVSQLGKTPDVQLDSTISYINSNQRPKKSILKTPKDLNKIVSVKSTNKVNFNDHNIVLNEVVVDEETQLKMDLRAALSRIDSFNFDNEDEVVINTEKKLNFDDSHEESDDDTLHSSVLISATNAIPLKHSDLNNSITTSSSKKHLIRQNVVDEDDIKLDRSDIKLDKSDIMLDEKVMLNVTITQLDEVADDSVLYAQKDVTIPNEEEINKHNESIKVLRNRVVVAVDTPKSRRSNKKLPVNEQESEQKENKTPLINTRRRSTVKITAESKEEKDLEKSLDKVSLNETGERRKSRRSVKFSERDSSGSASSKPALPMTPHIRRSKAKSSEKQNEDLISWGTPEKLPDRVRRSRSRKSESRI